MCNMDLDQKCILLCAIWIRATKNEGWSWGEGATCGVFGIGYSLHLTPRVPWNVFDQVMHAAIFYRNMHIATCNMRAVCILRCNIDSFLLNKKGLESMSILPKNFCNMHIARCNMHIAIESILPLTYYALPVITKPMQQKCRTNPKIVWYMDLVSQ